MAFHEQAVTIDRLSPAEHTIERLVTTGSISQRTPWTGPHLAYCLPGLLPVACSLGDLDRLGVARRHSLSWAGFGEAECLPC